MPARRALLLRRGFVKRCRRVTGAHAARNRGGGIVGGMTRGALLLLGLTLVRSLGDPAAIALENMRLNAELREQLEELRSSRARLVEACDAERRRLERNLHDGAQQRLVAVAVHLGRLQRRVRGDAVAEEIAAAAAHELAESLQELRELAHGLHPAVLQHGLAAALAGLATRSPVTTTVSWASDDRLPQPVELAPSSPARRSPTSPSPRPRAGWTCA